MGKVHWESLLPENPLSFHLHPLLRSPSLIECSASQNFQVLFPVSLLSERAETLLYRTFDRNVFLVQLTISIFFCITLSNGNFEDLLSERMFLSSLGFILRNISIKPESLSIWVKSLPTSSVQLSYRLEPKIVLIPCIDCVYTLFVMLLWSHFRPAWPKPANQLRNQLPLGSPVIWGQIHLWDYK